MVEEETKGVPINYPDPEHFSIKGPKVLYTADTVYHYYDTLIYDSLGRMVQNLSGTKGFFGNKTRLGYDDDNFVIRRLSLSDYSQNQLISYEWSGETLKETIQRLNHLKWDYSINDIDSSRVLIFAREEKFETDSLDRIVRIESFYDSGSKRIAYFNYSENTIKLETKTLVFDGDTIYRRYYCDGILTAIEEGFHRPFTYTYHYTEVPFDSSYLSSSLDR